MVGVFHVTCSDLICFCLFFMHVKATVFLGHFCSNPSGFHMADSIDFKYLKPLEDALGELSLWVWGLFFCWCVMGSLVDFFFNSVTFQFISFPYSLLKMSPVLFSFSQHGRQYNQLFCTLVNATQPYFCCSNIHSLPSVGNSL